MQARSPAAPYMCCCVLCSLRREALQQALVTLAGSCQGGVALQALG